MFFFRVKRLCRRGLGSDRNLAFRRDYGFSFRFDSRSIALFTSFSRSGCRLLHVVFLFDGCFCIHRSLRFDWCRYLGRCLRVDLGLLIRLHGRGWLGFDGGRCGRDFYEVRSRKAGCLRFLVSEDAPREVLRITDKTRSQKFL